MIRRAALVLIAAALVGGGESAGAAVARPAPVVFHKQSKRAEVELRLPKSLDAWPAFRDALRTDDVAKLNGFVRAAENGGRQTRRNWRTIRYRLAGTTPRLVSVIRRDDRDTGGAHPLPSVAAVIWDQRTKRRLSMGALFRPDADLAPLDEALCDAIKAAKSEREGAAPIDDKAWRCPLFSQTSAALAPSTVLGKAGGLVALINPYEVGPFAEGLYQVVVPLEAFRKALRRPYLSEFAGAPSAAAEVLTEPDGAPRPAGKAGRLR